jgi:hypothetical protein
VQRDYAPILVPGEQVVAAFRTVRDIVFLTNLRMALVDVQGLTGEGRGGDHPLSLDHAVQRRDGGQLRPRCRPQDLGDRVIRCRWK